MTEINKRNDMNLLDVYSMLTKKEITTEQAALSLGVTEKSMKIRAKKWGHKLPLLLATLDKIKSDTITREEAATTLNVSSRQVNMLQKSWNVSRPIKTYLVEKARSEIKWEIRKKYAIDYVSGGVEIAEAAERAGVSTRQMRRWVSELLKKHEHGMEWKDLATLSEFRRRRLADEMDEAENLEMTKQDTLKLISNGRMEIGEEALKRVRAKRGMRDRRLPNV